MNDLPTGARGKALAIALCVLVIAATYLVIVSPLIALYDANAEQLQGRQELAQRLQRSAKALPTLRNEADAAQDQTSDADLLLDGDSDSVAAAALQSNVKDLVESAGAQLISSEVLPSDKRETLQRVGIHVSFTGNLTLLTTVLQGFQLAHPVILVDNVDIQGADGADQSGGPQKQLAIGLDVYGFKPL
jgi:general secretion pathway protein M